MLDDAAYPGADGRVFWAFKYCPEFELVSAVIGSGLFPTSVRIVTTLPASLCVRVS